MKKFTVLFMVVIMIAATFSGCGSAQETVKTGLAVITSAAKSADVTAGTGLAEMDSYVYAVTVDSKGKIVKCVIDSVQTKVNFSDTGKITTPLDTILKTKNELGAEYGMKANSGIGKEWNEQAAAFANYVIGKSAGEVAGIAVDEKKYATGADLISSVTINIGGFIEGVQKAMSNAKDLGAKNTDKLGIGVTTSVAASTDAGDAAGLAQAYSYYAATTTDANGKITSCILDASQTDVNFDNTGKITSDTAAVLKTKNELGDAYGMKSKSGIGKEWYEEAAAFADYVIGKTASEVKGIAIDDTKHATGADLVSSVTIGIGDFQETINRSASNAK